MKQLPLLLFLVAGPSLYANGENNKKLVCKGSTSAFTVEFLNHLPRRSDDYRSSGENVGLVRDHKKATTEYVVIHQGKVSTRCYVSHSVSFVKRDGSSVHITKRWSEPECDYGSGGASLTTYNALPSGSYERVEEDLVCSGL